MKIWELVKDMEEGKHDDARVVGEAKATFIVNFGTDGRSIKGLVSEDDSLLQMIVKTYTHCNKTTEDLKRALEKIVHCIDTGKSELVKTMARKALEASNENR